jgi:sortase A
VKPVTDTPARRESGRRAAELIERAAWALGFVALAVCGVAYLIGNAGAHRDLVRFEARRVEASQPHFSLASATSPDLSLWDIGRIDAWRAALAQPAPPALAVLRIPKIGLEVAVLPGTDDFVLNRAVGHIDDTAMPGMDGNAGIAGHRDGFFRGLKDIGRGDAIDVETLAGRRSYRVERTWIVDPDDVSVLDPTPGRALTLVTCYPFYFVGPAPERFIVRAVEADEEIARVKR